jgi:hypothetical protein
MDPEIQWVSVAGVAADGKENNRPGIRAHLTSYHILLSTEQSLAKKTWPMPLARGLMTTSAETKRQSHERIRAELNPL